MRHGGPYGADIKTPHVHGRGRTRLFRVGLAFVVLTALTATAHTATATAMVAKVPPGISFTGAMPLVSGTSLLRPTGVALNPAGTELFIADSGHDRIQRYAAGLVTKYELAWGAGGSGPGQLSDPQGIAVDGAGHVFVADTGNNRIEEFTADGAFVAVLTPPNSGIGPLSLPAAVAVDHNGNLVVADTGNNRIVRRSSKGEWTLAGTAAAPHGVAVDSIGLAYVANTGANEIDVMTPDGTVVTSWTTANGNLNGPTGIALDGAGKVFVVDAGNNRVIQTDTGGRVESVWGSSGAGDSQFNGAYGVAVGGTTVYVSDTANNRVQQFVLQPTVVDPPKKLASFTITPGFQKGEISDTQVSTVTSNGSMLVASEGWSNNSSPEVCKIDQYDNQGTLTSRFGAFGTGPGQLCSTKYDGYAIYWGPFGVDNQGQILVQDTANDRIEIFTKQGNLVTSFKVSGTNRTPNALWDPVDQEVVANGLTASGQSVINWYSEQGQLVHSLVVQDKNAIVSPGAVDPRNGDVLAVWLTEPLGSGYGLDRYSATGQLLQRMHTPDLEFPHAVSSNGVVLTTPGLSTTGLFNWYSSGLSLLLTSASLGNYFPVPTDGGGNFYVNNYDYSTDVHTVDKYSGPTIVQPDPLYVRSLRGTTGKGASPSDPGPVVAVGPDGTATVVWEVFNSTYHSTLWVATRRPGESAFEDPQQLESVAANKGYDELPAIATGPDGTTTVVWQVSPGSVVSHLLVATRQPGAEKFSQPKPLAGVPNSDLPEFPHIAAGRHGAATIAWVIQSGTKSAVWVATRKTSAGPFTAAPIDKGHQPQYASIGVAVASDGSANVVWQSYPNIFVAIKPVGKSSFGTPQLIGTADDLPIITSSANGPTTIAYSRQEPDRTLRMWVSTRAVGAKAFGAPVQVEAASLDPTRQQVLHEYPAMAEGPDGTTTLVWQVRDATGWRMWTATRLAKATTFGAPTDIGPTDDTLSGVAVGLHGAATVVWQTAVTNPYSAEVVTVVTRPSASQRFGAPYRLVPGMAASDPSGPDPQVAAGTNGAMTIVWDTTDVNYTSQFVWQDSTASGPLPLAARVIVPAPGIITTSSSGTFSIKARCASTPRTGCNVAATITSGKQVLTTTRTKAGTGQNFILNFGLTQAAQQLLKAKHSLSVGLTVTSSASGYRMSTTTSAFVLK